METTGNIKILMDNRWDLEDLYKFPRNFEQVYFAYFSLLPSDDEFVRQRVNHAFAAYPWKGGYSAVNFYNQLKYTVSKKERPSIESISYASPGWIELNLIQEIALNVGVVVGSVCATLRVANATYNAIYKGMQERKLTKLEIQEKEFSLSQEHYQFLRNSNIAMGDILKLNNIDQIGEKTGNELRTLKILLSIFRRVKILAEYEANGKAKLPRHPKPPSLFDK